MSPEMLRLLEARYERDTTEPAQAAQREATYRRLFNDFAARRPPAMPWEDFQYAIDQRYWEFRRARRKTSTLPPTA